MATSWPIDFPLEETVAEEPAPVNPLREPYSTTPTLQKEERTDGDTPERASLRVYLYSLPVIGQFGEETTVIVGGDVAAGVQFDKGWKPPEREPMVHYETGDWHGPATTALPERFPEEIRDRMIATIRAHHGPHNTTDECCRRRAALGGEFQMPELGIPKKNRE